METKLAGQGAEARVTGAYAGGGRQHLDYDTTQEHAAPNTTSDLAFRGVLADRRTAVWRGMIRVDPGAQQTDAFQESRNLLLSTKAHADAIPGLEIEANDVRCTHAAAVAQIDREQLFYLRARGLDEETAKRLIIEAFLEALVERLAEGRLREEVSGALEQRLGEILAAALRRGMCQAAKPPQLMCNQAVEALERGGLEAAEPVAKRELGALGASSGPSSPGDPTARRRLRPGRGARTAPRSRR